jgi:hypothetical protein
MKNIKDASDKKTDLNDQLTVRKEAMKASGVDTSDVDDVAEDLAEKAEEVVDTVKEAVEDITE